MSFIIDYSTDHKLCLDVLTNLAHLYSQIIIIITDYYVS